MALLRRASRGADQAADLAEVLRGASLPSFPQIATTALELLGDPDCDMREVGDVIVTDPGLSSGLLRIVNSAAFGGRRQVHSVHQAVAMIGVSHLESHLITMGVKRALPTAGAGHDPRQFWTAAARRAAIASTFAERLVPSKRSETFTAALLQDMAMPVLADAREDYGRVLNEWRNGDVDLVALENATFGSDHATVASQMCDAWDFPDPLRDAIATHHDELAADDRPAPFVQLVSLLGDTVDDGDTERLVESSVAHLGLSADVTLELVAAGEGKARQVAAQLL